MKSPEIETSKEELFMTMLRLAWLAGAVIITATPAFAQSEAAGKPDTAQAQIGNYVNAFRMDAVEKTAVGYQYWFVGKEVADGKTLKMSVVKPHSATHAPHVHAEEEFFFVLEGTVELYLNGQREVVGPYSSFYCPPNSEHGIRNVGDTEAKYLVMKKYEKSR